MTAADDLVRYVERETGLTFTDDQARALGVLHVLAAPYNLPIDWRRHLHRLWRGVEVRWDDELATWDASGLTLLVFAAHDAGVRLAVHGVRAGNRGALSIVLTARESGAGIVEGHPTLDGAVESWRLTRSAQEAKP